MRSPATSCCLFIRQIDDPFRSTFVGLPHSSTLVEWIEGSSECCRQMASRREQYPMRADRNCLLGKDQARVVLICPLVLATNDGCAHIRSFFREMWDTTDLDVLAGRVENLPV